MPPQPDNKPEQKLTAEQAEAQRASTQTTSVVSSQSFNAIPEAVFIRNIVVFLLDVDCIKSVLNIRQLNTLWKERIDKNPNLQERLRLYAIDKKPRTPDEKRYLQTDLVKNRIRKGLLTVAEALRDIKNSDRYRRELINLGFSSVDITRMNPRNNFYVSPYYPFNDVLKKYVNQPNNTDKKISAEEPKTNVESLSAKRAEKLETFFNTILNFSDAHLQVLMETPPTEMDIRLEDLKNLSKEQLDALKKPLGFSETWIKSNLFSIQAYRLMLKNNKLPEARRFQASDLEQMNPGQALLLEQGVPLSEIQKLNPDLSFGKLKQMAAGLKLGYTLEDVKSAWFSNKHIRLSQEYRCKKDEERSRPIPPAHLRGFTGNQALGFAAGFSVEQVQHPGYVAMGDGACYRIQKALKKGFTFKQIVSKFENMTNLEPWQKKMCVLRSRVNSSFMDNSSTDEDIEETDNDRHLTVKQVKQPWFTPDHAIAINLGFAYNTIEGLTSTQLDGLKAGLRHEQVKHDWFMTEHLNAIRDGISYESIIELTTEEVKALRDRISQERVLNIRATHALSVSSASSGSTSYEEHKRQPMMILSAIPSSPKEKQAATAAQVGESALTVHVSRDVPH